MNDIVIKTVTAVCLGLLCFQVIVWLAELLFKGREKRILFLNSFKKGRFATIYLTAMPLYVIGHMYDGQSFGRAFFGSIAKIVELVVLKYDFDHIESLMENDRFYRATIYVCFIIAIINTAFVAVSILSRRIWSFFHRVEIELSPKDRLFIFGNNPQSINVYKSDSKRSKVIIDKIADEDIERFYFDKISCLAGVSDEKATEIIFKKGRMADFISKIYAIIKKDAEEQKNTVIINTDSDERNILLCRNMIERISAQSEEEKERLFRTLGIFVFGDLKYEAIYEDVEAEGCGCVSFVNKYKKIASDFIESYPLAYFMTEKQVDYKTSLIRKGVDINFFMLCFGNVGRQIFLTSVANNQFLTEGENGPELKKVRYHIFDKEAAQNNKNLNHNYYRYRNELPGYNPEEYLPLPSLPAEEHYYHFDINDEKLYSELEKCVQGGEDANFVLVSFGNDLENIDMAQKLVAKRREWGKNFVIFVRTQKRTREQLALEAEGCLFIGDESEVVYNIDKILSDKIRRIAIMRNEDYDLEYAMDGKKPEEITDEFIEEVRYRSFRKWHINMHRIERESNIFAALSMRAKLNLMGLDYCEADGNDEDALTYEQYLELYAGDDIPDDKGGLTVSGRKIIRYGIDFRESRRKNMAVLEHYRWNSYYISKGFVPASIKQIKEELIEKNGRLVNSNGKNYSLRRHGNLTTFEGLERFRKIVAEREGAGEEAKDVIKYDYQILDDIYYFLTAGGYKIIKKK